MSHGICALAVSLALGAGPYSDHGTVVVGPPGASVVEGLPMAAGASIPAYTGPVGGVYGEPLFPYDSPDPWMHGYYQKMPSYGGHSRFRPYNYKHVLSQSQVAGGWGMPANMPYSQQFWHRYADRAQMRERDGRDHGISQESTNASTGYGTDRHLQALPTGRESAAESFPSSNPRQQRFAPQNSVGQPAAFRPDPASVPYAGPRFR